MLTFCEMRFGLIALIAVLLAAGHANAQPRNSLDHQSWSTEAGLPQSSVHQILQSRDGYLWLATEGGVVRYDGISFKILNHDSEPSFTSDDVSSLAEDRAGNLWFGTADGLIEDTRNHLRRFGPSDGLPGAAVGSVAADRDGSVVVLTSGGIASFDGSRFRRVQGQPASVDSMGLDPDGTLLLVGQEGVFRLVDNMVSRLSLGTSLPGPRLRGILRGPDGTKWLWSDREVLASAPGKQENWRVGGDLPGARIQSVLVDRRGVTWIGTNRGLVTVTPLARQPRTVKALGANSILSMLEDAEGNLWIGAETSGLHALRPRTFRAELSLADEEVSSIVQALDGAIWIGTRDDGLRRIRFSAAGSKTERPVTNEALTSPVILSLAPGTSGDVWVGTPDGLTHVTAGGKTLRYTSSDGLPDDLVRSLLVAHDGTVWIGTRRGLAHLRAGRFEVMTKANGLVGDLIGTLFESANGDIWVATLAGVSRVHDGIVREFSAADGLGGKVVTSIAGDNAGRVWVSTRDAGLFLMDGDRFRKAAVHAIPQEIFSVIADGQGFLWMRVRRGIVRARAEDLARCGTQGNCGVNFAKYGIEDHMPSEEMVADAGPSALRTSDGELWFATRKGVAIADPAYLPINRIVPPVVMEAFRADNDEVPLWSGVQSLRSAQRRYTFEYAGLSYTVPTKVLYRSKLEGFDKEWSSPTTRRYASYTNLPSGTYTFRVQAANNDGLWNLAGAEVQFRILPPIYRRWWFVLGVTLAVAVLAISLHRLRLRRLQLRFNAVLAERNRIAREIHDTLAQDFVGVSLQLDVVSQLLAHNKVSEATSALNATRRLVKAGLEEARQSIWNLRANSRQGSLPSRVTALARRFSTGDLTVKAKIGGAYRELPSPIEDEVLKIMQEAITNVQRHASAKAVDVHCQYQQDRLVVQINDDGHGFSVDDGTEKPGHFGLWGMRERAASLGGELKLSSSPGVGTVVELVVPIADGKGSHG
jgi:signal transduction histidine kinase/streptogramin lyase